MSNIPVWAMGYALRAAGVPCAEEIAMMLCKQRRVQIPTVPTATLNFKGFGGTYYGYERYYEGTGLKTSSYSFDKGKMPTDVSYTYDMYYAPNKKRKNKGTISISLNAADAMETKAGDYISIRFLVPYLSGNVSDFVTSSHGRDPNYFTIDFCLDSAEGVEESKTARYKLSQRVTTGESSLDMVPAAATGDNLSTSAYCPMLDDPQLQMLTEEDVITGWELSGWLRHPLERIGIDITGHFDSLGGFCMSVFARFTADDLQVNTYE